MNLKHSLLCIGVIGLAASCHSPAGTTSHHGTDYGSPESVVTKDADTSVIASGPISFGAELPKISDKDTVEVKLGVRHQLVEIRRGVKVLMWPFGGSVPGPNIHLRVGQTVKFTLVNNSNLPVKGLGMNVGTQQAKSNQVNRQHGMNMAQPGGSMPHSIDFHAAMVNPADKYRTVNPGEAIHFTFTANYPGVFMYHCGTPMVLQHMIYGMLGAVIVDPKGGYNDPVDTSFVLVQNEFYLRKHGDYYLPDTASAMIKQPTYVAFNGKPGQYVVRPLKVKAGTKIRIYLLNAGPNNSTAFHIIGTIMDKVWMDGNPYNETHGRQTVLVGASNGAVIDVVLPEPGTYTFVDHSYSDAERGAIGAFKAE